MKDKTDHDDGYSLLSMKEKRKVVYQWLVMMEKDRKMMMMMTTMAKEDLSLFDNVEFVVHINRLVDQSSKMIIANILQ
jgi:hypothetical protein